ncbi:MAG: hypothetical protein Q8J84_11200 [Flavobacteriaceae bacterium]|nr:hypothetical protein [Flavobacteriaceae bacterium]
MKYKKTVSPSAILKIDAFWKWFDKNSVQIENAVKHGINSSEVLETLNKKIKNISNCVGFMIKGSNRVDRQFLTIIFTVGGQLKKVRWVTAFENRAPSFPNWKIQALVQPYEDLEKIKSGDDKPFKFHDFELKISEMYFNMVDYDIHKRTISIKVYLQNYKFHYDNPFLKEAVEDVLEEILGEIALKNSISEIQLAQIPNENDDLIPLCELPQYIILINNSNRKLKI